MAVLKQTLLFCLSIAAFSLHSQTWKTYPYQEPESVLVFPKDEGFHPGEPIEWWYTNARVNGESTGTEYSIMLTYFHYPVLAFDGFRILNIANESTGEFFDETLPCTYPILSEDHLEIQANVLGAGVENWTTRTDENDGLIPFEYHLSAAGRHGAIDLTYTSLKRPLMVGGRGFLNQGVDNYTYYYSLTKIAVSGSLTVNGFTEPVSGVAWIDRQYGDFNPNTGEDYEWFSLQLSNEMDINLWNIFTFQDEIPDTSTYRYLSAYIDESTSLTTSAFGLERLAYAWMPDEEVCYAQQWRLTIPEIEADLMITARHPDQEVALPFRFYEGTTDIEGTIGGQPVTGRGFAELLKHYQHPSIQILYPASEDVWDPAQPIRWRLSNPDDGRPVFYDVAISYDNQETYVTVAERLPATEFLWDPNEYPSDAAYWLRVTGYSVDSVLIGTAETNKAYPLLTSISELEDQVPDIRLFPNPTTGSIIIQPASPLRGKVSVRLLSPSGQMIKNVETRFADGRIELDLSDQPAGLYFLEILSDEGVVSKKLIRLSE